MGSSASLRQQHRELLQLIIELAPLLDHERLVQGCTGVRLMLSAFVRKLNVHLALEERFVYGRLLHHPDEAVVATTTRHHEDTRQLHDTLAQYAHRWALTTDQAIEMAPSSFVDETKSLFDVVSKRFELENEELYPLLDQVPIASGTWTIHSMPPMKAKLGTS